jgi:ribose transport system permease protein
MKPADEVSARAAEPAVPAEVPDEDVQEEQTWLQRLAGSNVWIFLILGGICLVFALLSYDSFASTTNLRNISVDAATLLVLAVGSTFVIITAGIDLSVGSVLVFSGVVSAWSCSASARPSGPVSAGGCSTASSSPSSRSLR